MAEASAVLAAIVLSLVPLPTIKAETESLEEEVSPEGLEIEEKHDKCLCLFVVPTSSHFQPGVCSTTPLNITCILPESFRSLAKPPPQVTWAGVDFVQVDLAG